MTDLDHIIDNANLDIPEAASPNLPKRPGLWRVLSMLAVFAAMVITALAVLQARAASDVAVPDRAPVPLDEATVTVTDLPVPAEAQIAVLGFADSLGSFPFDASGTRIDRPRGLTTVVALTDGGQGLFGMAVAHRADTTAAIEISPRSTAQALILLSPGVLQADLEASFLQLDAVEQDPSFDALIQAVRANPSISSDNEALEVAYADIADRIQARQPRADQGCDSVIARDAYSSAGTCVQPGSTGLTITNEQDRWALIYSGATGLTDLCAVIAPTETNGSEILVPSEQCVGDSLMVAPGRVVDQGALQPLIDDRIRAAAALNMLYDYAMPFADLVGASAGSNDEAIQHIRENQAEVVMSLDSLIETSEEFAAAVDVSQSASTALDRHVASISTARLIIDASDSTALIPRRSADSTGHLPLLDFYTRAGERMVSERTDWRWDANASDMVDFGGDQ